MKLTSERPSRNSFVGKHRQRTQSWQLAKPFLFYGLKDQLLLLERLRFHPLDFIRSLLILAFHTFNSLGFVLQLTLVAVLLALELFVSDVLRNVDSLLFAVTSLFELHFLLPRQVFFKLLSLAMLSLKSLNLVVQVLIDLAFIVVQRRPMIHLPHFCCFLLDVFDSLQLLLPSFLRFLLQSNSSTSLNFLFLYHKLFRLTKLLRIKYDC